MRLLSLYVNIQYEIPYIIRKPVLEGVRVTHVFGIPMRDGDFRYFGLPIFFRPSTAGSPPRGRNQPARGWPGLLELGPPICPAAPDFLDAAGAQFYHTIPCYHTVPSASKLRLKLTINFSSSRQGRCCSDHQPGIRMAGL